MSFPPLRKNTKECFLALDIGTEAVKALVFEKGKEGYCVWGRAMDYFDPSKPFDKDRIISKVKEEAVIMSGRSPKSLLLGLPATIFKSRVGRQIVRRNNPEEIISEREEKNIHQRVFEEIKSKIAERFARESGILAQHIHFVGLDILEIKIDGYEISGLSGYGGKNLEFKILVSFLPEDYFTYFSKTASKLGLKMQEIVNPVRNLVKIMKASRGIFLDVGGEVTQICLIKNRKIDLVDEIGRGGRDFTRAISETLGVREQEARILKEDYSRGDLTEDVRKRIREVFTPSCREWSADLKLKLKDIKGLIPSDFFLFGGGGQLPEIAELAAAVGKEAKLVYLEDFENVVDKTNSLNSPQFVSPILLFYGR